MRTTRLSPRQIQWMTKHQETNLPDVATIRRPTYVVNELGGTEDTYIAVYEDIPIYSESRILREIKEDVTGSIVQSGVRWVCHVKREHNDIRLDDRVEITETNTGITYTLEVTSLLSPQSYSTIFGFQCILVD